MSQKSTGPTDLLVGRNIRIHRLARRMTQTALASELGITFQQLQKYEKGVNRIGSGRLARIAEVFGLPIAALFEGSKVGRKGRARSSVVDLIAERGPIRLVQAFARIEDRNTRRSIISLVESVADVSESD